MSNSVPVPAAEALPQMAENPEQHRSPPTASQSEAATTDGGAVAVSANPAAEATTLPGVGAAGASESSARARPGLRAQMAENPLLTLIGGMLAFLGALVVGLLSFVLFSLDSRVSRLEDKVDAGFAAVYATIDARFAEQDKRFEARFAEQDKKIAELDEKIAELDDKIGKLDDKVDRIELKLTALIARLDATEAVEAAVGVPGDADS